MRLTRGFDVLVAGIALSGVVACGGSHNPSSAGGQRTSTSNAQPTSTTTMTVPTETSSTEQATPLAGPPYVHQPVYFDLEIHGNAKNYYVTATNHWTPGQLIGRRPYSHFEFKFPNGYIFNSDDLQMTDGQKINTPPVSTPPGTVNVTLWHREGDGSYDKIGEHHVEVNN